MKKEVWKFCGICVLTIVTAFSFLQLALPRAKASSGCPSDPFPQCICDFEGGYVDYDPGEHWYCTYSCNCGGVGGAEPFFIIREVDFRY